MSEAMIIRGNEIFRCMDYLETEDTQKVIEQLGSHLKNGILSPTEMREKGITQGKISNIINGNHISVHGGNQNESNIQMIRPLSLSIFATKLHKTKAGIIIDSPVKIHSDHLNKHYVIDALEVPVEKRNITGIVINIYNLSIAEIQQIQVLGETHGIPVFAVEKSIENKRVVTRMKEL